MDGRSVYYLRFVDFVIVSQAMNFSLFSGIFAVASALALLMILATAGFILYHFFDKSRQAKRSAMQNSHRSASGTDGKRRALDIIAEKKSHQSAHKCHKCGATIDSTAELSADGKVRCNYCNEWTSIY